MYNLTENNKSTENSHSNVFNVNLLAQNFLDKSKVRHGEKYDYSKVEYKNNATKVKIICKEHGLFEQTPNGHLKCKKNACPVCSKQDLLIRCSKSKITQPQSNKNFIKKAKEVHGDKYDYSKVEYKNSKTNVLIVCKIHGEFLQTPNHHTNSKNGCPDCNPSNRGFKNSPRNVAITTEAFIKKAKELHGDKYDYSKLVYVNSKVKVAIICEKHGEFLQRPDSHLSGLNCDRCAKEASESKKIPAMDKFLSNHIVEKEKTFSECKMIKMLRFDRFIEELNLCIEYDGEQHFRATDFFGGEESFKVTKKRDKIKTDFCRNNKINLLRIKYNQDPVEEVEKMLEKISSNKCIHMIYGKIKEIV